MGSQNFEEQETKKNQKQEVKASDVENKQKQNYSGGPTRERKCTDFIFCLLMIGFWIFCIYLGSYSFSNGDLNKIKMVMDDDNVPCGSKKFGTENHPYGYFYQPLNNFGSILCVKECPQWPLDGQRPTSLDCFLEGEKKQGLSCSSDIDFSFSYLPERYLEFYDKPLLIYNTTKIMDTICFMSEISLSNIDQQWFKNMTLVSQVSEKASNYIEDVIIVKWDILYIALISVGLSLASMFLIRLFAGVFVWITILMFLTSIFVLAFFTMKES